MSQFLKDFYRFGTSIWKLFDRIVHTFSASIFCCFLEGKFSRFFKVKLIFGSESGAEKISRGYHVCLLFGDLFRKSTLFGALIGFCLFFGILWDPFG